LPLGLGPDTFEDHRAFLEKSYLTPKNNWDQTTLSRAQKLLPRETRIENLMQMKVTKPRTAIRIDRNLATLEVDLDNFREVLLENTDSNATNSTSFLREPSSHRNFVRGSSTNIPFAPGGLEKVVLKQEDPSAQLAFDLDQLLNLDSDGLKTVPPGFDRGLVFEDTDQVPAYAHETVLNIQDILGSTGDDFGLFDAPTIQVELPQKPKREQPTDESKDTEQSSLTADLDDLIPTKEVVPVVATKAAKPKKEALKEWAYVVDVNQPFPDFYEKVPELAHKFPFELDLFQKRAVYHLENGDSVFIAAHTSAGKTVVAEYAIALAQKHMTRAIYTSPIKALSNQKFRDFKDRFEDVGILTGDVQIKPEASCLIMTTEILRSMLYRGADLIRDVEFVIFDEVHYVNDAEV
ncbi:hypothetical protein HDU99_002987, partial [Rhizoclosmatium hyalinum]